MSVFSSIGNFFRGAFGESDDEKKRRQQQAAQAAAQRQAPKPQQPQLQVQQAQQPQPKITIDKPTAAPTVTVQPPTPAPRVAPQAPPPLPDTEFRAITAEKKVRQFLPDQTAIAAKGTVVTNADKYVASYDKLSNDVKKVYYNQLKDQANSGDKVAQVSLRTLQQTNRVPQETHLQNLADVASVPGRSILRVGTGMAQGASGLYDLLTPGKNTSRVSKALDTVAKDQDKSARNAGIDSAYKAMNVPVEIASYFIPTTIAGKLASRFPTGTKLTEEVVNTIANNVDDAGDAGKVRRFLADRMRRGWTLDRAAEEAMQSGKYIGEDASKGHKTTPGSIAMNTAQAVGGSLLFPGRAIKSLQGGEDATQRALGTAADDVKASGGLVEPWYKNPQQGSVDDLRVARELGENPKFGKKEPSQAEADYRAANSEARAAEPTDTPPLVRQGQDAIDKAKRDYILKNGVLTDDEYARQLQAANAEISKRQAQVRSGLLKVRNQADLDAFQKANQDLLDNIETHKKISDEMVAGFKARREATQAAVDSQKGATDAVVETQQAAGAKAAADQAAQTAPDPAKVVQDTPTTASPEVTANDGYRPTTEETLFPGQTPVQERDGLALSQKLSPDRFIRENVTRPAENLLNRGVDALQTADNKPARGLGRFFGGFSKEAGVAPELQTAKMHLRGGVETGKLYREAVADLSNGMSDGSKTRVWATLDPEQAARKGVDPGNLSPEEAVLRDKLKTIIDNTTSENLRRGLVTPEQAANGSYIKRSYTVYDGNEAATKFEGGFRQELLGQYKGRKQVSDAMVEKAITDPTYLVGKKTAESEAMWSMQDYGNFLSRNGDTVDMAKPGYTQLPDSPVFGDSAGKFVPKSIAEDFVGFQYNNAMVSAFNDMITAYDRLGIRQAKKQLLTIFNPAVRAGNQVTNRVIFTNLNGINPIQFNAMYLKVGREIAENSPIYREAVEQGLTGIDISQADFFAKRIADSAGQDRNVARKALDWVQTSYSGADDKARVTAYIIHRNRGYSAEEAARITQRGFQDYKSVGFFYDMAAKTPIIGNAFVRFAADSVRIAKNAAVDHPLRSLSTVAAWAALVNGASVLSGESKLQGSNPASKASNLVTGKSKSDAQKDRENRFGSPKLPFTNISTAVQTPWGEVNAARFMPWYQLSDVPGGNAIQKVLPLSDAPVEVKDGKLNLNPQGMNDPLLGQFVQIGMDKDFRGKSIADPKNDGQKYDMAPLGTEDKLKNIARFLFNNNAPVGREIDQTVSAAANTHLPGSGTAMNLTGGKDIYGKERNIWQALARDAGLKIEQQGSSQAKDRASINAYMQEKAGIDKELQGMSPAAQEAWKRITGYYKLRDQVPNEFAPGETRDKKAAVYDFSEDKWKDYAAHPELYQLMVDKKVRESSKVNEHGIKKPLQPEFDPRLPESFRKQLIQNKMVAPGDDAELDQRMYSTPDWDYYQKLKTEYTAAAKQYYPQSTSDDFSDETVKHTDAKFPDKPDAYKAYTDAYAQYSDGKAEKPAFTDQVKAAREQYQKATFDWTNKERAARGLPAITWDVWNNPTFGFDDTPSNSYGYGGGGSKYNPADHINTLLSLSNFTGSTKGIDPIKAKAMPQLAQMFAKLKAGGGSGKQKAKLGASSSGR